MSTRIALPELKIASPCPARWEDMRGDDRRRFCDACGKHVHNFAAMRDEEIAALLDGRSICARLYRRDDGTILTADCPVGVRLARTRLGKATLRIAAFVVASFGAATYALTGTRIATVDRASQSMFRQSRFEPRAVSGGILAMPATTRPTLGKIVAPTLDVGGVTPATRPTR